MFLTLFKNSLHSQRSLIPDSQFFYPILIPLGIYSTSTLFTWPVKRLYLAHDGQTNKLTITTEHSYKPRTAENIIMSAWVLASNGQSRPGKWSFFFWKFLSIESSLISKIHLTCWHHLKYSIYWAKTKKYFRLKVFCFWQFDSDEREKPHTGMLWQ